jgi:hypothetical protein
VVAGFLEKLDQVDADVAAMPGDENFHIGVPRDFTL